MDAYKSRKCCELMLVFHRMLTNTVCRDCPDLAAWLRAIIFYGTDLNRLVSYVY